jgi:pimeloyl-ACP methyl ester carboxylesterase
MAEKLHIVFVHGAWTDGSCWHKVIPQLKAAGHEVSAAQHSLTSLQSDVEITRRLAEAFESPALLIGHSYGGAVITEAACICHDVRGLVYIAAFAPDAGESLGDLSQRTRPARGNVFVHPDKYGNLWMDREKLWENFCQDINEEEALVMAAVQKPIAIQCFTDKVSSAGWKNFPSWYQISELDRIISPELESYMAARLNPKEVVSLPSSHASMISHPKEIADLILRACKSI